jgi:hypothetical protein
VRPRRHNADGLFGLAARARAWSPLALGLAALLLIVGACSSPTGSAAPAPASAGPTETAASASDSGAPSGSAPATVAASPVAGIVVAVDSAGLDQVKGFTLRTNNGDTLVFTIGTLDNADEFPPGHLKEHQASGSPVFVFFREENGQLVAYHIEDAP